MSCMVINMAYESTIKSHLTIIKRPKPIETLAEMANKTTGDIIWAGKYINDLAVILKQSPIPEMRSLMNDRTVVAMRTSYAKVYGEVLDGHIVISSWFFARYEIIKQLSYKDGTTDVQIVPQGFTYYHYVYKMPRMSRFRDLINSVFKNLHFNLNPNQIKSLTPIFF